MRSHFIEIRKIYIALVVVLFCIGIPQTANCQLTSEKLEEVVTVFFINYSVPTPLNENLSFCRKSDRLYVVKKENFRTVQSEEIFYNFISESYEDISLFKKRNLGVESIRTSNFTSQELLFAKKLIQRLKISGTTIFSDAKIYPFYGYPGFYNDVIELYSDKKELGLNEQIALCRATSFKVVNMFYEYYPLGLDSEKIRIDNDEIIDSVQLTKYLSSFELERRAHRQLMENFPEYITSLGSVEDKYGSIVMHSYLKLLYNGNEQIASEILEAELFTDSTIAKAKNILNSCPENSILFNYGDLDTYPLY